MWMVQVKKAMGFILIAMAFYFLRPLIGDLAFQYGVAASLLDRRGVPASSRALQGAHGLAHRASACCCSSAGVAFAIPRKHEAGVQWEKYDARSARRRARGRQAGGDRLLRRLVPAV